MSGGHFDYAYQKVNNFADDLESQLDRFEGESRDAIRAVVITARYNARMMKEAEWLYSGDTDEATFLARMGDIINEMETTSYELENE